MTERDTTIKIEEKKKKKKRLNTPVSMRPIGNRPVTFYELVSAILIFCAITKDPFLWWFVPAPIAYQGVMEYVRIVANAEFRKNYIQGIYDREKQEGQEAQEILDKLDEM